MNCKRDNDNVDDIDYYQIHICFYTYRVFFYSMVFFSTPRQSNALKVP